MAEKWVGHVRIYTPEDTLKEKPGGDFGEAKWERNGAPRGAKLALASIGLFGTGLTHWFQQ